tara:strand:- start:93862 stop:94971 length:1110 start_codon:yes stop_codon:yes gene_type:complete
VKLLIITHAVHKKQSDQWFAYGPYVKEMRLWEKYADELLIVAPLTHSGPGVIDLSYKSPDITFYKVPSFSLTSVVECLKALFAIPFCLFKIWKAMRKADHIHLRCPGNMGLLGCMVQVFFPKKKKSAKYAGNWDPKAKQPLSYRFQKWILNNTFLTRNMQVMVYGHWEGTSKNIVPFFTATYPEAKKEPIEKQFLPPFTALFVGGLTPGKDALYAVQLVHHLQKKGIDMRLDIYGEGVQREELMHYIATHKLAISITLKGNQPTEIIEKAYKESHILILPSKSEGFPKVVAEAMFWGCIPFATPVSCVPEMLGEGERGVLLTKELEADADAFCRLLSNKENLQKMSIKAQTWSQQYTLEAFEEEIRNLI